MGIEQLRLSMKLGGASSDSNGEGITGQWNGQPRKSPSAPSFHEKVYTGRNVSEPVLPNQAPTMSVSDSQENASLNDADASLSVINLYGDEVESRRAVEGTSQGPEDILSDDPETSSTPFGQRSGSSVTDGASLDRYGFKKHNNFITENEYNRWWRDYSQYCVRRKHKWKLLLEKSGFPLDNDSPYRFPPRSEKLKRYVRKGIPAEWRGNAWWHFARGQEKLNKNKGVYDTLLFKMDELIRKKKVVTDLDIIERDLNRTFPDNMHFQRESLQHEEPPMIKSLRRVLVAFSLYNPKIGYCQSMNFLAGLLLLFMDEERTFWMLVIITSRYLPGVHNVNLEGVNIDQGVLMLCVKEYLPEFWRFIAPFESKVSGPDSSPNASPTLGKNEFLYKLPPITLCTASWFMSCFVGVLPIESTLRVWDCLFYEESNFLFKASLAILKLSEQELAKARSVKTLKHHSASSSGDYKRELQLNQDEAEMEIFQVIQTFPKRLLNPNDMFDKVIFKKRIPLNRLDQDEVDRCRKYVAAQRLKYKNYHEIVGASNRSNDNMLNGNIINSGNQNNTKQSSSTEQENAESAGAFEFDEDNNVSDFINNAISSEVYGFKRGLSGVHWNNSIKEKVRQMRKKKVLSNDQLMKN